MFQDFFVINRSDEPKGFRFSAYLEEFNEDYVVVLKIGFNFYFTEYDDDSASYTYVVKEDNGYVNPVANEQFMFILYDYNQEKIIETKKGEIVLESIPLGSPQIIFNVVDTIPPDSREWRENALVNSVDGPYQDGIKVNEIDLNKAVEYFATPSSDKLSPVQILSMKWRYRYNKTGDHVQFNHSQRSIVTVDGIQKCKIECRFHNREDIETIDIYPFFYSPGTKVFSSAKVKGFVPPQKDCRITLAEIEKALDVYKADRPFRQQLIDELNKYIYDSGKTIHIDTPLRKAHFFAQVAAETNFSQYIVEPGRYNYSVQNCKSIFGQRAKDLESAGKLEQYANERPQKSLFNWVYSNKYPKFSNGNGDFNSGDGFKYRGRGLIQLTGRANYRSASKFLKEVFPDEYKDLEQNPEIVGEPKYAVLSAISFWESNEVWKVADDLPSLNDEEAKRIRRKINGNTAHWKKAKEYFEKGNGVFEVNCNNNSSIGSKPENSGNNDVSSFNADGIVTFHIYANGNIEKHIPKTITSENKNKYKYIYHSPKGYVHEICTVNWFDAQKMGNGKKYNGNSVPSGYTRKFKYPSGGDAKDGYEYENGDIYVTGSKYGIRYYPKSTGTVELVRMKDKLSYNKGGIKVYYTFLQSQRRYCNPECYAGFIGALAEIGRMDVQCTGMCFEDSTSYPSLSHPNGDSADTAYFYSLKEEQIKVNAFRKFHFTKIYRGKTKFYPQLNHTAYSSGHETHLHSGDFDLNVIKIVKEK